MTPLFVLAGLAFGTDPNRDPSHAACSECHSGHVERWSASRHAQSATNANFRAAIAEARHRSWCLSCHEPLGTDGVTCQVCHVDHETPRREVCADCHEFAGPSVHLGPLALGGDPLQSTWSEWKASPAAARGEDCVDCHLDRHGFRGAHDAERVRSALSIEATPDALSVRTTDALGHRIPTGDPFRRLEIALCSEPTCAVPLTTKSLGVLHTADAEGWMRITTDTRLGPPGGDAPDRITLPRRNEAGYWRVRLLLADPGLTLPDSERFLPIASGRFP